MKEKTFLCLFLVTSMLSGCLPGEKQQNAVIEKAMATTKEVHAYQIATDLTNAVLTTASTKILSNNPDLKTVLCPSTGKNSSPKVIAYIPVTSKLAHDGKLSASLGLRMLDQLKSDFGPQAVGMAQDMNTVLADCGIAPDMVAINAPVLMTESFAQQQIIQPESNLSSIQVRSCDENGQKIPGIIVRRTTKDGQSTIERHCGQAISTLNKLDLGIATALMPNWKKRLAGDANAVEAFKCIVRHKQDFNNPCVPLSSIDKSEVLKCTEKKDLQEYVVNPVYTPSAEKFTTGADKSCGHGWTGQLVARIKSRSCTIMRDGKQIEPATIHAVYYVGAKCSRENIQNVLNQCPVGSDNRDSTFYARYGRASMKTPIAMETTERIDGNIYSSIAPADYRQRIGIDEINKDIEGIKSAMKVHKVFFPEDDSLKGFSDNNQFANALIRIMGKDNMELDDFACNAEGNRCMTPDAPDHIVVILDQSASMGSAIDTVTATPAMASAYECRAGLKNLFRSGIASETCKMVKEFNQHSLVNGSAELVDYLKAPWAGQNAPTGKQLDLYHQIEDALTNREKYRPYLQRALATGWTCDGRNGEDFPDNMFGSCDGPNSCHTCAGQCEQKQLFFLPKDLQVKRIEAAQMMLEKLSRMRMKPGTRITFGSFVNDVPSVRSMVYCPSEHQGEGFCDNKSEQESLSSLFIRRNNTQVYVRDMKQTYIIPTEKFTPYQISKGGVGFWETFEKAKQQHTEKDEQNKYDFGECFNIDDCGGEEGQCEYVGGNAPSAYNTPECRGARECQANRAQQLAIYKDHSWYQGHVTETTTYYGGDGYDTYCTNRRLKDTTGQLIKVCRMPNDPSPSASSAMPECKVYCDEVSNCTQYIHLDGSIDNEELLACLDRCRPHNTSGSISVEACYTAQNLFNGKASVDCQTSTLPTILDYRPSDFYSGRQIQIALTRKVRSKANDADSSPAPMNQVVQGADYGGNTPLFRTIDETLNTPEIQKDMTEQKKVRFIVMTDGVSTDRDTVTDALCGTGNALSARIAKNANAKLLVVGFNPLSPVLNSCPQGDLFINDFDLVDKGNKMKRFIGAEDSPLNATVGRQFCIDHFGLGAIYSDAYVLHNTGLEALCRGYERE